MLRPHAALTILFGIACTATHPLLAQQSPDVVAPGDQVRFKLADTRARVIGAVAIISSDSLWLASTPRRDRSVFSRAEVLGLQRRLPGADGAGRGAIIGVSVGAGLGGLWGQMLCEAICEGEGGAQFILLGAGVVGVVGLFSGALIGGITTPAHWTIGIWPTTHGMAAGLSIPIGARGRNPAVNPPSPPGRPG